MYIKIKLEVIAVRSTILGDKKIEKKNIIIYSMSKEMTSICILIIMHDRYMR